MPAVPNVAKLDVNLDENVDGSPYDVCLWHLADQLDGALRGQLLTQSGNRSATTGSQ
jgi:hypothetical protein